MRRRAGVLLIAAAAASFVVGRALESQALGPWDELLLPSMDGGSPLPVLLASALARAGFYVELSRSGEAPYIALPASWEDAVSMTRNASSTSRSENAITV